MSERFERVCQRCQFELRRDAFGGWVDIHGRDYCDPDFPGGGIERFHIPEPAISGTLAASADAIARTERALGMFPAVDAVSEKIPAPYSAQWGYPYSQL